MNSQVFDYSFVNLLFNEEMEAQYSEAERSALLTHNLRHARFVPCPACMHSCMATWGLSVDNIPSPNPMFPISGRVYYVWSESH